MSSLLRTRTFGVASTLPTRSSSSSSGNVLTGKQRILRKRTTLETTTAATAITTPVPRRPCSRFTIVSLPHSRTSCDYYSTAILRGVTTTFSNAIVSSLPSSSSSSSLTDPISVTKARQQHQSYADVLKSIVPKVIEIDADDAYPDCVFIEDTAIVIDQTAVITRIGTPSRQGEVDATKGVLQSLGLEVHDMRANIDEEIMLFETNNDTREDIACCDGGDVLYPVSYHAVVNRTKSTLPISTTTDITTTTTTPTPTHHPASGVHVLQQQGGTTEPSSKNANAHPDDVMFEKKGGKHLFVGISSRTNWAGANYLQKAFPHVQVVPVDLMDAEFRKNHVLHLKSVMTHLDHETLLIPRGSLGDKLCSQIMEQRAGLQQHGHGCHNHGCHDHGYSSSDYNMIRLPDIAACNVVCLHGTTNSFILAQPNICQESKEILIHEVVEKRGMVLLWVDASEFAKCDGALTCKSILIP